MLHPEDLEEDALGLVSRAGTARLLLTTIDFDLQFGLWSAIDAWTGTVTGLPYVSDPDLLAFTPRFLIHYCT
jgi:hypothetical protein